MQELEK